MSSSRILIRGSSGLKSIKKIWVGNRGLAARTIGNGTNGDGSYSNGTGQLCGTSGGGWKWSGIFIRDMIGGNTLASNLIPTTAATYYTYNWRVYGA